jgi:hypothetical protein
MAPHCDTLDGPVVKAALKALETGNINYILPWAPQEAENEIKSAFDKVLVVRKAGKEAQEMADYWFFETVVRLHRAGEGAPFTGLKPAGLDWGPVVPKAEQALETGDPAGVVLFLTHLVEESTREKFNHALALKVYDQNNVKEAREYIHAMLTFVLGSHALYSFIRDGKVHDQDGRAAHEH